MWWLSLSVSCASTVERPSGTHEKGEVCGPEPVLRRATRASHQATGHIPHSPKHTYRINSVTYLAYRRPSFHSLPCCSAPFLFFLFLWLLPLPRMPVLCGKATALSFTLDICSTLPNSSFPSPPNVLEIKPWGHCGMSHRAESLSSPGREHVWSTWCVRYGWTTVPVLAQSIQDAFRLALLDGWKTWGSERKRAVIGRTRLSTWAVSQQAQCPLLALPRLNFVSLPQRKPAWFVSVLDTVRKKCLWNLIEIKVSTIQQLGVMFVPQQLCLKAAARVIGRREGTISGIYKKTYFLWEKALLAIETQNGPGLEFVFSLEQKIWGLSFSIRTSVCWAIFIVTAEETEAQRNSWCIYSLGGLLPFSANLGLVLEAASPHTI